MLGRDHALPEPCLRCRRAAASRDGRRFRRGRRPDCRRWTLADIDEPGSTISREGGFATRGLAHVARRVSGGHRKGSHSLIGLAVFTLAAWVAVLCDGSWPGRVSWACSWACCSLLPLTHCAWAVTVSAATTATSWALAAATAMVYWHAGLRLVPVCVALGSARSRGR